MKTKKDTINTIFNDDDSVQHIFLYSYSTLNDVDLIRVNDAVIYFFRKDHDTTFRIKTESGNFYKYDIKKDTIKEISTKKELELLKELSLQEVDELFKRDDVVSIESFKIIKDDGRLKLEMLNYYKPRPDELNPEREIRELDNDDVLVKAHVETLNNFYLFYKTFGKLEEKLKKDKEQKERSRRAKQEIEKYRVSNQEKCFRYEKTLDAQEPFLKKYTPENFYDGLYTRDFEVIHPRTPDAVKMPGDYYTDRELTYIDKMISDAVNTLRALNPDKLTFLASDVANIIHPTENTRNKIKTSQSYFKKMMEIIRELSQAREILDISPLVDFQIMAGVKTWIDHRANGLDEIIDSHIIPCTITPTPTGGDFILSFPEFDSLFNYRMNTKQIKILRGDINISPLKADLDNDALFHYLKERLQEMPYGGKSQGQFLKLKMKLRELELEYELQKKSLMMDAEFKELYPEETKDILEELEKKLMLSMFSPEEIKEFKKAKADEMSLLRDNKLTLSFEKIVRDLKFESKNQTRLADSIKIILTHLKEHGYIKDFKINPDTSKRKDGKRGYPPKSYTLLFFHKFKEK